MDGNSATSTVGTMTAAVARQDMLNNISNIAPVPYYVNKNGNKYRRQTMSERNAGEGGFWVMFDWGLSGYELHVHYSKKGGIKGEHVKVAGSNLRGGQVFLSSHELTLIRERIKNPPAE